MVHKTFFVKCVTFLLSILLFVLVPLLLLLNVPFLLFRVLVSKSAKYFNPSLGKMISSLGSAFAADDLHNKPTSNFSMILTLEGNVDIEKARESVQNRVVNARFPNGDLKYPELKQCITTWGGYYFWKDVANFDILKAVRLHDKPKPDSGYFGETDIQEIREEMVTRKWAKNAPLWEIILITNCRPDGATCDGPHTIFILRVHHSTGDGYSWLNLLTEELCQTPIKNARPNYVKRALPELMVYVLTFPFRMSYELAEILIISCLKLPFRVTSEHKRGKYILSIPDRIPMKKIKEIRAHFEVTVSSVLFAVVGGAIRDILIKKGMDVPMELPVITAQPLPDHTKKLRNFMTAMITNYPTGETDPESRLKLMHSDMNRVKRSTMPTLFKYLLILLGTNMSCVLRHGENFIVTTGLSNFPGGMETVAFNGHKWVDFIVTSGLQTGCAGLGLCALGYIDGFRIAAVANDALLSREDLKYFTDSIGKHLDILHQRCLLNKV